MEADVPTIRVQYDRDGTVHLEEFFTPAGTLRGSMVAAKWQKALFAAPSMCTDSGKLPWEALINVLVMTPPVAGLAAQVMWHISMHVERALLKGIGSQAQQGHEGMDGPAFRVSATSPRMDEQLFSYVSACAEKSRKHRVIGIATDKANPCSGSFFNTVISFPNNRLAICCPQVTPSDDVSPEELEAKRKRKVTDATFGNEGDFEDAVAKRQRAGLTKDASTKPAACRPIKWHRVAAKRWLMALDNQLKTNTRFDGLQDFFHQPTWAISWRSWPGLGLSMDFGSDGVAAYDALQNKYRANCWLFPGESHSIKNSFAKMLRATKCVDLWLLLLVSWNLDLGPRQEEARRSELRSELESCYASRRPPSCPFLGVGARQGSRVGDARRRPV